MRSARRIRSLRVAAGLSQAEVARAARVGQSFVSMLEIGCRKADVKTWASLEAALFDRIREKSGRLARKINGAGMNKLICAKDAAQMLGTTEGTLKSWRSRQTGPKWVKSGASVRYDMAELLDYIRRNTRTPSVRALVEEKA